MTKNISYFKKIILKALEERLREAKLPNSRFFRDYCVVCNTPMRVTYDSLVTPELIKKDNYCEQCSPKTPLPYGSNLSGRQRSVLFRQSNKDI